MTLPPAGPQPRNSDRRFALMQEWRRLADQATQRGYGDFLSPPRARDLLPASAGGPVVVVNVSGWSCDALIVLPDGVHARPLTGLAAGDAATRTTHYLDAVRRAEDTRLAVDLAQHRFTRDASLAAARRVRAAREDLRAAETTATKILNQTLRWLWEAVAEPVLRSLDELASPSPGGLRRIWWCPTGELSLLPLHAAGYHDHESTDTLLDQTVSSYTPTVRALAEALRPRETLRSARMLLVTLPETQGQAALTQVERERDFLLTCLGADGVTVLDGSQATRQTVRDALRSHAWAHISCHGTQFLDDPSRGGLLLQDGILSVTEISAGRHQGDFICLSACKTAVGGHRLPDEAITLSAALHYTGYRHVVGTLWSVGQRAAADFTESLYGGLIQAGGLAPDSSAFAIRDAAFRLRADRSLPPFSWMPFTHTGP